MKPSMKKLYSLALAEGEGLGTAYEYYVKIRLIMKVLKGFVPRSVLIYGLPPSVSPFGNL